jgi:hypothetical protein
MDSYNYQNHDPGQLFLQESRLSTVYERLLDRSHC